MAKQKLPKDIISLEDRRKKQEAAEVEHYHFLPYEHSEADVATMFGEFGEPFEGETRLIAVLLDREEGMGIVTSCGEARKLIATLEKAIADLEKAETPNPEV